MVRREAVHNRNRWPWHVPARTSAGYSWLAVQKCRIARVSATRLKPLVKIHRSPFLARRKHAAVLSRALEEALFRHSDVISEGGMRGGALASGTYFGSTMIAIAFDRLAAEADGRLTRSVRAELVHVVEGSVRVRLRAMRLARAEAARRVPRGVLGTALCDLRVRDDGKQLRIDVDLEVEVRVSSRAKRS
jgi:hypothetical protein